MVFLVTKQLDSNLPGERKKYFWVVSGIIDRQAEYFRSEKAAKNHARRWAKSFRQMGFSVRVKVKK